MDSVAGTNVHAGDIVVIAGYFTFVLAVGLYTSMKNRGSAGGYFLAGRNMNWIPVGASLFASNIGSLHFVGLAGSGAAGGISVANYELNAIMVLMLLGYVFLPVYIASGIYTMPQYLQRRFGGKRIQIFLSVLTLLMYIFTKISADLYSGSIFIEQSLNWNMYYAVCLLLVIAAIFTVTGGLTAVIWTDFIQTIIMLVGAAVLMGISFYEVGGFNAMVEKYPHAISNYSLTSNDTCGKPRDDYMHLFRDPVDGDIPWPGILGLTINSVWYWCSDQVIVQRALAAKTFTHAKAGTLLCGVLKLLPLFMLVFPGMIARILFPETVGCSDPDVCMEVCGSATGCSNIAYPTLVINLLPAGARGVMLAVMLAALMSSLTSIFNSSSTIFAMDVWTNIRKQASELELMIVGRIFVIFLVVVSIIWIPVIKASQGTQLYVYIQEVSSFLQPPICAVFVLGLFWGRLNEKGAFAGLIMGFIVGVIRFAVQYAYTAPDCGSDEPDPTPDIVKNFHYLYFSVFLFFFTLLVSVVTSLFTKPIDDRCLQRLTWGTRHSKKPRLDIEDWLAGRTLENGHQKDHIGLEEKMTKLDKERAALNKDMEYGTEDEKKAVVTDAHEMNGNGIKENDVIIEDNHLDIQYNTPMPCPRRLFNWVCGIDPQSKKQLANQQLEIGDMLSIKEPRRLQLITAAFTVALLVSTLFLYVFFA
ncbi:sodium/glucose cotransporter [Plakobranchus ocellatus]|uniref:Sodium/glucose cotransporter n=1 Tax=Plakobranchus ocellatus TaxID=259542 RepID=A0AAV3ZHP4_9GAST|nr:sodium/glucose cotransporter [Plakobranchus ocellatus]